MVTTESPPSFSAAAGRLKIAMVCDFFYPRFGGVENHIWSISQSLLKLGHKVIVITHSYDDRSGVRWMSGGLKVYYTPLAAPFDQASVPTLFGFLPMIREILIREQIQLVHGHQATSQLTHESLFHARALGLPTVYTDHSLFGFSDMASINVNKVLRFTLANVEKCICVSNTCRENLVLRASVDPARVLTLPNAVDSSNFKPNFSQRPGVDSETVNIVVMSRMVYRKGIDLLVGVLPLICARFPQVKFIIGGDGSKMVLLHETRERYLLHDRMELLGHVPHAKVQETLRRGNIFLNCSLTESFCIAIVEAASCGLFVVSTKVGGVAEVLPDETVCYAEPTVNALVEAVAQAIPKCKNIDTSAIAKITSEYYNWDRVAERTVSFVYRSVEAAPKQSTVANLARYRQAVALSSSIVAPGPLFGIIICMLFAIDLAFLSLLRILRPKHDIEICPDWPSNPKQQEKVAAPQLPLPRHARAHCPSTPLRRSARIRSRRHSTKPRS